MIINIKKFYSRFQLIDYELGQRLKFDVKNNKIN